MAFVADILLIAGALSAGLYCMVLSRRLKKFTDLERGMGGAVAVLSVQVDDMTKAMERARTAAGNSAESLESTTARAEGVAQRLELLLAAMHDLPDEAGAESRVGAGADAGRSRRVVWRRPHPASAADAAPPQPKPAPSGARMEAAE